LKVYQIIKMFILPFMLGVYVMFLMTIAAAHYAGGWVVVLVDKYEVLVDKYEEGFFEVVLLSSLLPLAAYVTFREVVAAYREAR